MRRRTAWLLPASLAILFAVLCAWAVVKGDTPFAIFDCALFLLNAYLAYRWFTERRASGSDKR